MENMVDTHVSADSPWGHAERSALALSRRQFLARAAGITAALALGGGNRLAAQAKAGAACTTLPDPTASGIEHVVVVMMENRSFDHVLGWLPGAVPEADGRQAGLTYVDGSGHSYSTYPLAPDYQGCSHPDPDHSYEGGRVEFDNGACDGWLRAGSNDVYAIGYYTQR